MAHDRSNNQTIHDPKEDFYRFNDAEPKRTFTRAEADALLGFLKAQNGGLPICYWGNISDEQLRQAMSAYDQATGVFSQGVSFCDPNDPANASNIRLG